MPQSEPERTDGRDSAGRFAPGNEVGSRFQPGNTAALIHGGRRMQLGPGAARDKAERVALRDLVLQDLGGETEVSAVMRELVEDFAGAVVLRDLAYSHIAANGPLTKAGRRRAVVGLYLEASGRVERLAARIGTRRRPARIPSLAEHLGAKGAS